MNPYKLICLDIDGTLLDANRYLSEKTISVFGQLDSEVVIIPVSYTHLRAHETVLDLVCRLLLEKKTIQTVHELTYTRHPYTP